MLNTLFISAITIVALLTVVSLFKSKIIAWAKAKSVSLKLTTLRQAIKDADKDKAETDRKNIVVYNTDKKEFEPIQKQLLKGEASINKGRKSKAIVDKDGFFVGMKSKTDNRSRKKRTFTYERVKSIEKNTLYATN